MKQVLGYFLGFAIFIVGIIGIDAAGFRDALRLPRQSV